MECALLKPVSSLTVTGITDTLSTIYDLIKESWPVPCLMCAFHGSCYNSANGVAMTLELNPNHTVPVPDYVTRVVQDGDFDYNTLPHDARNHLSRFDRLVVTDIREIL